MTNPNTSPFVPTETWEQTHELSAFDESIQAAVHSMNAQNPTQLIDRLENSVETSEAGVSFAVLKGENPSEYSDSEALVIFNPFANAATPNMLLRAEFIRGVAKYSDVRDANGKLKPVVMLASPGLGGSKLSLTRQERHDLRDGELGPVARELLHAVTEQDIGKVSLFGFSQGADVALAGADSAFSVNLDTDAVAVGDPAGVETRSMAKLGGDFSKAGTKDLKAVIDASHIDAQKAALGTGLLDFSGFVLSGMKPMNIALYRALGKDRFETNVQRILDEGVVDKLVVGYGGNSAIAKPEAIEPAMQRLYELNGQDSFTSIRVDEGKHTWGDQLTMLAKLYMRAVA